MVAYSVNLEAHGLTVFAFFDMVGTDIFDSTASQTTALGHENWFEGWGSKRVESSFTAINPCSPLQRRNTSFLEGIEVRIYHQTHTNTAALGKARLEELLTAP